MILHHIRKAALGATLLAGAAQTASALPLIFNSPDNASNEATRQSWLNTLGITNGQHFIDFETGFEEGQQIGGMSLDGGLVLGDTPGDATPFGLVVTGQASNIGSSNPVGFLTATHDNDFLRFDFSAAPVDYIGFLDIDQSSFAVNVWTGLLLGSTITFADDLTYTFGADDTDTTASSGNSAEFFGLIGNDMGQIKYIDLATSGDATWGIDNIEFGWLTPLLPEADVLPPQAVPDTASTGGLLIGALGLMGMVNRRRRRNAAM